MKKIAQAKDICLLGEQIKNGGMPALTGISLTREDVETLPSHVHQHCRRTDEEKEAYIKYVIEPRILI